jgi:hypothetical protein
MVGAGQVRDVMTDWTYGGNKVSRNQGVQKFSGVSDGYAYTRTGCTNNLCK